VNDFGEVKVSGKVSVNISIEIDESILGILRKTESWERAGEYLERDLRRDER